MPASPEPAMPSRGDPRARQIEALAPRVLAWAHMRLRAHPTTAPEDLAQEVLYRAFARLSTCTLEAIDGWVFAIANRVLLEVLRSGRRALDRARPTGGSTAAQVLQAVADQATTLTRAVGRTDAVKHILRLAAELDPVDHKILLLRGLEGLSNEAAAVQVGLSEEACAKRWYRLRERLRSLVPPAAGD